jgi:Ulp1 family protease
MDLFMYLCIMKNEITIPILLHDLEEKDKISAAEHRKKYSAKRDIQAMEFNQAIVTRLAKDKEKQELIQSEDSQQVSCEICGKALSADSIAKGLDSCPKCKKAGEPI